MALFHFRPVVVLSLMEVQFMILRRKMLPILCGALLPLWELQSRRRPRTRNPPFATPV